MWASLRAGLLPRFEAILAPELTSALFLRSLGGGTTVENLDVVNAAVSLLIRAVLLAARFSGVSS